MTRELLADALNEAFKAHFKHLFDVLMASHDNEALDRFSVGLNRTIERHDQLRQLIDQAFKEMS